MHLKHHFHCHWEKSESWNLAIARKVPPMTMSRTPENNRLSAVHMLQARSRLSATARQFGVQWSTSNVVEPLPKYGKHCWPAPDWSFHSKTLPTKTVLSHLRNRLLPATITADNIPGLHGIRFSLLISCARREKGARPMAATCDIDCEIYFGV